MNNSIKKWPRLILLNMACQSVAVILLLFICITQELNGAVVSKKLKDCERQTRQLNKRIKNASKDFKYLTNSFDCNIRYIFDGAYSSFYSDLEGMKKTVGKGASEECTSNYEIEVVKLGQQPYDICYSHNLLSKEYDKIDRFEESARGVCQNCNTNEEQQCIISIQEISKQVEDFQNSSAQIVKDIEKKVEECVNEKVENVAKILKDINDTLHVCMHSD